MSLTLQSTVTSYFLVCAEVTHIIIFYISVCLPLLYYVCCYFIVYSFYSLSHWSQRAIIVYCIHVFDAGDETLSEMVVMRKRDAQPSTSPSECGKRNGLQGTPRFMIYSNLAPHHTPSWYKISTTFLVAIGCSFVDANYDSTEPCQKIRVLCKS